MSLGGPGMGAGLGAGLDVGLGAGPATGEFDLWITCPNQPSSGEDRQKAVKPSFMKHLWPEVLQHPMLMQFEMSEAQSECPLSLPGTGLGAGAGAAGPGGAGPGAGLELWSPLLGAAKLAFAASSFT